MVTQVIRFLKVLHSIFLSNAEWNLFYLHNMGGGFLLFPLVTKANPLNSLITSYRQYSDNTFNDKK
jgi:hypothetical protein